MINITFILGLLMVAAGAFLAFGLPVALMSTGGLLLSLSLLAIMRRVNVNGSI